ncbi:MAG: lytic transglycosylase domain-containing protein [Chloroflexi bacterium]|nr:lytic transglycosylase domain-containing protein [Chloroflexota bacterium]
MHSRRWLWAPPALIAILAAVTLGAGRHVEACAFDPRRPHTYEADQQRQAYLAAMDAAAVNRLFPGDTFFGLPPVRIGTRSGRADGPAVLPAALLKAIGWVESDLTMASRSVAFHAVGDALVSFDCGHGVMQVTTGMTIPLGDQNRPTDRQVRVATHYVSNIARGAWILADKWNQSPEMRPIAGTDTGGNPQLIENWYFAVWAYNGFTGPGSSQSNHPLAPSLGWPRPAFRCDGTQARNRYPYQELVWGCLANPPSRNQQLLWTPVAAALPDLTQPVFFNALAPARFQFPYSEMDIPTPQPANVAVPPVVAADFAQRALGSPALSVTGDRSITLLTRGSPAQSTATVSIRNAGTGILSWHATTSDHFLVLSPPAGVAVGGDLSCSGPLCPGGTLAVTVNPTLLPRARSTGTITIQSPNATGPPVQINVLVVADFEVGTPGTSRAR